MSWLSQKIEAGKNAIGQGAQSLSSSVANASKGFILDRSKEIESFGSRAVGAASMGVHAAAGMAKTVGSAYEDYVLNPEIAAAKSIYRGGKAAWDFGAGVLDKVNTVVAEAELASITSADSDGPIRNSAIYGKTASWLWDKSCQIQAAGDVFGTIGFYAELATGAAVLLTPETGGAVAAIAVGAGTVADESLMFSTALHAGAADMGSIAATMHAEMTLNGFSRTEAINELKQSNARAVSVIPDLLEFGERVGRLKKTASGVHSDLEQVEEIRGEWAAAQKMLKGGVSWKSADKLNQAKKFLKTLYDGWRWFLDAKEQVDHFIEKVTHHSEKEPSGADHDGEQAVPRRVPSLVGERGRRAAKLLKSGGSGNDGYAARVMRKGRKQTSSFDPEKHHANRGKGLQPLNMVTNPGPLVRERDGKNLAATFRSGMYNRVVLGKPTILYRAGAENEGLKRFYTRTPPRGEIQARDLGAVEQEWIDPKSGRLSGVSPMDTVHKVRVPAGTVIYEGPAGYQSPGAIGGGEQIVIPDPKAACVVPVVESAAKSARRTRAFNPQNRYHAKEAPGQGQRLAFEHRAHPLAHAVHRAHALHPAHAHSATSAHKPLTGKDRSVHPAMAVLRGHFAPTGEVHDDASSPLLEDLAHLGTGAHEAATMPPHHASANTPSAPVYQAVNPHPADGINQAVHKARLSHRRPQRKGFGGEPNVDAGALLGALLKTGGAGSAVAGGVRERLAPALGFDPGGARLHTGPTAAAAARTLQAEAFTIGSNVFFGADRHDPHSPKGLGLLAHELTHVAQQAGGGAVFGSGAGLEGMEEAARLVGQIVEGDHARGGAIIDEVHVEVEGRPSRSEERRLEALSALAVDEAIGRLESLRLPSVRIETLEVDVELDLDRMSDDQCVDAWAGAIVRAARAHSSPVKTHVPGIQRKADETGLPSTLRSGVESLSGFAMDDVQVHRSSSRPARLGAHAHAQGADFHLAPGQEDHLPHEAWHVDQQRAFTHSQMRRDFAGAIQFVSLPGTAKGPLTPAAVSELSTKEKIEKAIGYSWGMMPGELASQVKSGIPMMVGGLVLMTGAQFIPGANVALDLAGLAMMGWGFYDTLKNVVGFYRTAADAKTDDDLHKAAGIFASLASGALINLIMSAGKGVKALASLAKGKKLPLADTGVGKMMGKAGGAISNLFGRAKALKDDMATASRASIMKKLGRPGELIAGKYNQIRGTVQGMKAAAGAKAWSLFGKAKSLASETMEKTLGGASKGMGKAREAVSGALSTSKNAVSNAWSSVRGWGKGLFEKTPEAPHSPSVENLDPHNASQFEKYKAELRKQEVVRTPVTKDSIGPGKTRPTADQQKARNDTLKPRQDSSDLDHIYRQAAQAQGEITAASEEIAKEFGGKAMSRPSLKGKDRALEKVQTEYKGEASRLVDVAGTTIVCKNKLDIYKVRSEIGKRFKIVSFSDNYRNPMRGGYRDLKVTVQASNGHIAEIQINLPNMQAAKDGLGHKLYEQSRSIRATVEAEGRKYTLSEQKELEDIDRRSRNLYGEAYKKDQMGEDEP